MKLNDGNVSRLGIFFFYDKDGIVDRYITYFIDDLMKSLQKLVIVCNGKLSVEGRKKFNRYTSDIIVRENTGLDVWAYKTALEFIGWDKLRGYDEVILANSTMMGPVYPFKGMFNEMKKRDVDFWGITKFHMVDWDPFGCSEYGYLPEHIQSHFIVYRKSFLESNELKSYWDNIPAIESYEKSVGYHESAFTKRFSDMGFSWDVYVDTNEFEGITSYPLMNYPKDLIIRKHCPIFKRRSFFQPYDYILRNTTGQPMIELYDYLRNSDLYDVNMIWENILRTCHQADIVRNLHLNYTLSSSQFDIEKINLILKNKKIALVMHLYFEDLVDDSLKWASSIPKEADVYITTSSEEKKSYIEKKFASLECAYLEVRKIENRGRDVSSILVGVADIIDKYEYICFVHDKKTAQVQPASVGEGFAYKCFANTLYNRAFVYNVLQTFEDNPKLGILSPPIPNHANFFPTLGSEWGTNYDVSKKLADELKFTVPIDIDKPPVAPLGTFFWFRSKALKPLWNKRWKYTDFPVEPNNVDGTILHAVERLYPFAAQQAGFYPAVLMVDKFANIEYTNLNYYARNYSRVALEHNICNYHEVMLDILRQRLDNQDQLVGTIQGLADDKTKMQEYIDHLESVIHEMYPKTSIKYQIKDRLLKIFRFRKEN